ncbi:hypothetical protein RINTHM_16240 [Richelia intracellularis HM01]|nr:hypothetical protein RINTHM_16240 [Richelia intracellularis HM01]
MFILHNTIQTPYIGIPPVALFVNIYPWLFISLGKKKFLFG